jgi:molybdopterin adenylyltransferase
VTGNQNQTGGIAPAKPHDQPRKSPLTAAVITVSDSCSQGVREDRSGPAVARELEANGFLAALRVTVPDEPAAIQDSLRRACSAARLVVTTGGTGISQRDVTPEATRAVCDRLLEGIPELMRAEGRRETPLATLSRGVCGTRGTSLILNLPGSPSGALGSLRAALPVLPHALELLEGKTEHASDQRAASPHKHASQ